MFNIVIQLNKSLKLISILFIILNVMFFVSYSAELPNSVDASKYKPDEPDPRKYELPSDDLEKLNQPLPYPKVQEDAKNHKLKLRSINIVGKSILSREKITDTYTEYLNKIVRLSEIYEIANKITELYHEQGYFLSLAYVPNQEINAENAVININIIEGYIYKVSFNDPENKANKQILKYLDPLLKQKPLKINVLENTLLRLNDLFGIELQKTLNKLENAPPGGIELMLTIAPKPDLTKISINNSASKFIGPHKLKFFMQNSVNNFNLLQLTLENTMINKLSRFNYFSVASSTILHKYLDLNLNIDNTVTKPNSNSNTDFSIKSTSRSFGSSLKSKLIKQRSHNLSISVGFNVKNSNNYFTGMLYSRDRIRTGKFNLSYDFIFKNANYNNLELTFTKGLNILNSSRKGDRKLSREKADPDFSKVELNYTFLRKLGNHFSIMLNILAQYADRILFSAEELGYGGNNLGKAFDSSEFSGDQGIIGMIEINCTSFMEGKNSTNIPYIFYDFGVLLRKDPNRTPRETAGSYGFGIKTKFTHFNGSLTIAWPTIKEIRSPIYGGNPKGPKILFDLNLQW